MQVRRRAKRAIRPLVFSSNYNDSSQWTPAGSMDRPLSRWMKHARLRDQLASRASAVPKDWELCLPLSSVAGSRLATPNTGEAKELAI